MALAAQAPEGVFTFKTIPIQRHQPSVFTPAPSASRGRAALKKLVYTSIKVTGFLFFRDFMPPNKSNTVVASRFVDAPLGFST
ncbi:MAG: hypothetical protein PHU77_02440 [Simplicispira sp.]|nr:hypothetical protein [Simplicispira sp.]